MVRLVSTGNDDRLEYMLHNPTPTSAGTRKNSVLSVLFNKLIYKETDV